MSVLTRDPVALDYLLAEVTSPQCGGTCAFLGTVRNGPGELGVTAIEYSGYEQMVEAEFARILVEVRERWPAVRPCVRHRLGLVPRGEVSIGIAAAAPHRAEAFDACRYIIEAVKERVPIWKRELREDGTAVWVDPSGHPAAAGPG
jgi:molybdopterin synthase catalytic subunit